ncbi:MAG TPA: YciI family protein [Phycisphaerales bacterium]|nr:YciI family protein [Phycisphaerales bacterium]
MKFALLVYENDEELDCRTDPQDKDYWPSYGLYSQSLTEAGIMVGGNALREPGLATTVRRVDQNDVVADGPFIDTKEKLGGLFVIEVDSLDDALVWAKKCPSVTRGRGSVEIRPILEMNGP